MGPRSFSSRSKALQDFVGEAPLERESIVAFIEAVAAGLPDGARVLDVGAGNAPYRELFAHTDYVTSDWSGSVHADASDLDIVAPADALPIADASFDAVICTQVLEHVPRPDRVVAEFHRVLKDDGRVFATVPYAWEEHEEPHDYFRYSRSGLTQLFEDPGFTEIEISARTDSFTSLAQLVANARWSIGETTGEEQDRRQAVFDRLLEISDELAGYAEFDGRQVFPLGYTVAARRPARPVSEGADAAPRDAVHDRTEQRRSAVLYLAPWIDLGGSDKGTIDWFKHIDRERWAPSIITTQPSSNRWLDLVEPYAEEIWNLPELLAAPEFPGFVIDFIVSREVEVVHIMNSRLAFDLLPDIAALPNPPKVVVQLHAEEPDRSGYVRYCSTRYGNIIDAYSVTSRQLADAMHEQYHVPLSKLHVIVTGVDGVDEFDPQHVEPFEGLSGTGARILWPGRIVQQKDPLLTIEVLRKLQDRGVDFTMDLVGDGEMAPEVRRRAEELGVADRIVWHPASHEMPRWYRSSDVLLMTSVFEGVPYVMYEALAMGVPVVVPAIPGNVELLSHQDSGGILIDPRDDADAYADALERVITDRAYRDDLGARARSRMLRDFSLEVMGVAHDALYEMLLEGRAPSPSREAPPIDRIELSRDQLPERTVAVIVPCYRHGQFIEEAIASIHAQTLRAAEIVVVDDASPDRETHDALLRIDRDPAVRVIRLARNGGPSVARNRALAEVSSAYVLPLDADDVLLPTALADMVAQLEAAPGDVGFIYPNALHFGNRNDYYVAPSYNLHLLMQANYCPATTLFDRRVFEAGVRYAESWTHGHEDWDLVLQLAGRGVIGEPAEGPTFKYRKNGFSRITHVEHAGGVRREAIRQRHPELYRRADEIKAQWAPSLSVVLLPGSVPWTREALAPLAEQVCGDLEVLALGDVPVPAPFAEWAVTGLSADLDGVAEAIARSRGRCTLLLRPEAAPALRRRTLVESVLRGLQNFDAPDHFVLGQLESRIPVWTQLDADDAARARPVGVAWRRIEGTTLAPLEVSALDTLIEDVIAGWEVAAPVQWRRV